MVGLGFFGFFFAVPGNDNTGFVFPSESGAAKRKNKKTQPKQQAQPVVWSRGNELQKKRETGLPERCRRRSPRRGRNKEKRGKIKKIKELEEKRGEKKEKEETFEWVLVFFFFWLLFRDLYVCFPGRSAVPRPRRSVPPEPGCGRALPGPAGAAAVTNVTTLGKKSLNSSNTIFKHFGVFFVPAFCHKFSLDFLIFSSPLLPRSQPSTPGRCGCVLGGYFWGWL